MRLTMTQVSGFSLNAESDDPSATSQGHTMKRIKIHAGLPASLLLLSLLAPPAAWADDKTRAEQPACGIERADPAAATPEGLVRAVYEIVSGPAKSAKDWTRLQRLHAPGAIITPTQHRGAVAFAAAPQALTSFIELNKRLFSDRGFYESEIFQRVQRFGHIAHVWSGYETREHPEGPLEARGINSFQLFNDGQRWCVLSATWDIDTPEHPMTHGDSLK